MPFNLTMKSERANALQAAIQEELTIRGYSPEPDPVLAEYITIMVINNKTPAQITGELEELIGPDYSPTFTDWLFQEAAKGASESDLPSAPVESKPEAAVVDPVPAKDIASTSNDSARPSGARNGVYQQAISALPSTSNAPQKRSASARSPSPSHPNKSRRTDLPTGPRAMQRDGTTTNSQTPNSRSLLDRVGGPHNRQKNHQRDEIQARIDNIVGNAPQVPPEIMMPPGFPMGMGMDMNPMGHNMTNPLMLQEMMMNQMALMAHMASSMGIINPATGQFGGPGFPMQSQAPNPSESGGGFSNPMNNAGPQSNGASRGRGGARGGRGGARGRGGSALSSQNKPNTSELPPVTPPTPIAAPTPVAVAAAPKLNTPTTQPAYAVPERPQSPTLCKFGLKCTNAHCRYSHPSPVATPESGVVLSNDPCEKGKDCKDKDCIKAHISPAVLRPPTETPIPHAPAPVHHTPIPCRFGAACTRPNCTFNHPRAAVQQQFSQPCRFGSACTRAQCAYQHPADRVLPTSFHRGLSTTGPIVNVPTPETGSMGSSHNKSMTFNNTSTKEKLEKQMKELEERKSEAEKAVKEAESAANSKKEGAKPVSIAA
ncbi:hypothetical protein CVT24_005961 [Panaeolus cyanescens]|uniref:C3H1-type domain-containing protein n=1 Tax=Panaeolus cyanescens TaxID=181874 RepID=A0A409VCT3_9AGAR|nr:hypothetical protein CVT24_005961 [Panaeolus cyanescens]